MKKHIIYGLVLTTLLLGGCSKLDITPSDKVTDKKAAYTNPAITSQILGGIYSVMLQEDTWGSLIPIRMEAGTDLMATRILISDGSPQNNSTTSQSSQISNLWTKLYQGINAANEFVYYSAMYTPDSQVKSQNVSEARFLRAYYYFTLVRLFGDVPFRTEPSTDLNNTNIARTSAVDIYAFIVKEMCEVEAILAAPGAVVYGHVSKTAAQAALADIYLNLSGELMKNRIPSDSLTDGLMYKQARDWSKKVIDNGAHKITTTYENIFMNQIKQLPNPLEQVWELQFAYLVNTNGYRTDSRLGKFNGIGGATSTSYAYFTPTVFALYSKDGKKADIDQRYGWNVPLFRYTKESKWNAPVYSNSDDPTKMDWDNRGSGKWRPIYANTEAEFKNVNYCGAKLSMYRISEMHLIYAEALNALGDQTEAVNQVNIVRTRAGAEVYENTLNQQNVFELIVDERARELCFEGKRRFDLVRWGIFQKKVTEANTHYSRILIANSTNKANITAGYVNYDDSKHQIMPIPQREIDNNKLIPQKEQNIGWGGNRTWK